MSDDLPIPSEQPSFLIRMAKPTRKPTHPAPAGTADDAFTARILEFYLWSRQRTQVLVVGVAVLVVLVVGTIYWINQRNAQLDRAAAELDGIQQLARFGDQGEARAQLTIFIDRFDGTPHEVEARLNLAELELEADSYDAAIEALEPVAPNFSGPLNVQATFLLGLAYEQAERWDEAASVFAELQRRAEFQFQRSEAGEGLVRARLALGDTAAAAETYRTLISEFEEGDAQRAYYEMRLAELTRGEM